MGIGGLELCPHYYDFADVMVNFHCHLDLTCSHLGDTHLNMSPKVCPEKVSIKGRATLKVGDSILWAVALD